MKENTGIKEAAADSVEVLEQNELRVKIAEILGFENLKAENPMTPTLDESEVCERCNYFTCRCERCEKCDSILEDCACIRCESCDAAMADRTDTGWCKQCDEKTPSQPVEMSAVRGDWLRYYPHALGVILGTGFKEFACLCGMHGLAKEYGNTIEILAVNADNPGTGQLRAFIAGLQQSFSEIFVWEVWNPDLKLALKRYGFHRTRREEPDETLIGFKWVAPSVHSSNEALAAPSSPKSDISTPASLQHTLNRFMGIK